MTYLGVVKQFLLPDSRGEHALFLSMDAVKWQLLTILASLYNDFSPLMGSQVCQGAWIKDDYLMPTLEFHAGHSLLCK